MLRVYNNGALGKDLQTGMVKLTFKVSKFNGPWGFEMSYCISATTNEYPSSLSKYSLGSWGN